MVLPAPPLKNNFKLLGFPWQSLWLIRLLALLLQGAQVPLVGELRSRIPSDPPKKLKSLYLMKADSKFPILLLALLQIEYRLDIRIPFLFLTADKPQLIK